MYTNLISDVIIIIMKKNRVLVSDYDETIRVNNSISNETINAINAWYDSNYFIVASGRSLNSLKSNLDSFKVNYDYLISNNGGVIVDKNDRLLFISYINYDVALSLIAHVDKLDISAYVVNDGIKRAMKVKDQARLSNRYNDADDFIDYDEMITQKRIAQLIVLVDSFEIAVSIAEVINDKFEDIVAYPNKTCVDIVCKGINKSSGIKFINDIHGFDQIYTIGDSSNDIDMIQKYNGYAVKNSSEDLLKVSKNVVESITDLIENITN